MGSSPLIAEQLRLLGQTAQEISLLALISIARELTHTHGPMVSLLLVAE
jgi:hypothetical protein